MKIYKARRDLFCRLLMDNFSDIFTFQIPKGGMAVWVTLNKKYSWESISKIAINYKLEIGEWQRYDNANLGHNSLRIGFATYNEEEIYELIERFKLTFYEIKSLEKPFETF